LCYCKGLCNTLQHTRSTLQHSSSISDATHCKEKRSVSFCPLFFSTPICGRYRVVLQCATACCTVLHLKRYSTPPCARQPPHCTAEYYIVLRCAELCCSVLRCVAVCCSVLQCVAVRHSVWQCDAAENLFCFLFPSQLAKGNRRIVLQCASVCCNMLQWPCIVLLLKFFSFFFSTPACERQPPRCARQIPDSRKWPPECVAVYWSVLQCHAQKWSARTN